MTAPVAKRACARCGCSIKLKNKSGFCQRCGVITREAKRTCAACGDPISDKSNGHCKPCSNKLRPKREVHVRRCKCGEEITFGSKTGSCRACWIAVLQGVVVPEPRVWCGQCERNVLTAEADRCASTWCKAKAVAA